MQFFDVSVREVDPGWEHAVLGLLGDLTLIRRFDPSAPVLRAVPEHDRPWLERRFAERRAALSFEPIGERRYRLAALAHREAQAADLPLRYVQWQRETLAESLDGARDEPREQTFGSAAEARAAFETRCAELVAAGEQLFDEPLALLRANSARDGALEQALARAAPGPARAAAAEV
ncbi:MAG: hypothetical protein KC503_19725, partial [Myxococcales bacterium]|nr:hypothetical protein [Myxococcales bacterium]